jgi:hypothetical protein
MRDLQKCVAKVHHFARICATLDESNMKIGYARVSTLEQNLDLQLQALKKAGCRRIFQEKISAGTRNRPEFQRMLDQIRVGDTIAVWKLDRLARSTGSDAVRSSRGRDFQNRRLCGKRSSWSKYKDMGGYCWTNLFVVRSDLVVEPDKVFREGRVIR